MMATRPDQQLQQHHQPQQQQPQQQLPLHPRPRLPPHPRDREPVPAPPPPPPRRILPDLAPLVARARSFVPTFKPPAVYMGRFSLPELPSRTVAQVRLRYNVVALSAIGLVWYLGAWDFAWDVVRRSLPPSSFTWVIFAEKLIPVLLMYNLLESAYALQYPPPRPPPTPSATPIGRRPIPASLSPAHRKAVKNSFSQDSAPRQHYSPFATPEQAAKSTYQTPVKLRSSLANSTPASANSSPYSSLSLSHSPSVSSPLSYAQLAGITLKSDKKDPLTDDGPDSPRSAFNGKYSPKTTRAFDADALIALQRNMNSSQ